MVKLKSSIQSMVNLCAIFVSQMTSYKCSVCSNHKNVLSSFMTFHRVCGADTTYLSVTPEFIPFLWGFSPAIFFCMSEASTWMSSFICRVVFSGRMGDGDRWLFCFVDIG